MSHGERKVEHHLAPADLVRFLRALADQAGGDASGDAPLLGEPPVSFDRLAKLELKLKRRASGWSAKLKIKQTEDPASSYNGGSHAPDAAEDAAIGPAALVPEEAAPRKEKYKRLKKRMDADFKIIRKAVKEDRLPPEPTVERFLEDSTAMVTYPGFGDPYYEAYMLACNRLRGSVAQGDLEAVRGAVRELREQEQRCHDEFK